MKYIIFCADDYGQNPTISQAIIELIRKNRLSATSCLTTSPYWLEHSRWLEPYKNQVDIGMHFNLTEGKPVSEGYANVHEKFSPVADLLKSAFLRRLDPVIIENEFEAQLDRFVQGVGQLPTFIDGHQHIHQFPVIRDAILKIYQRRLRVNKTYIRCVYDPRAIWRFKSSGYFKRLMIQFSGARAFKNALVQQKIPHNTSFSGIYDFADSAKYAGIFEHFLEQTGDQGLIMCHPGWESDDKNDEIAKSRFQEYQYFLSDAFIRACAVYGVAVSRLNIN